MRALPAPTPETPGTRMLRTYEQRRPSTPLQTVLLRIFDTLTPAERAHVLDAVRQQTRPGDWT